MSDRRYDESVRAIVARATAEAQRRGDRRLGTDHLLVGTLEDQRVAGALGVTATQARERIDVLDRDALAAIGLAVLVVYFRNRGSIAVEDVNLMKG